MADSEQGRHPALPPRPPPERSKTPTSAQLLEASPWLPAEWDLADASALQALARGDASPEMQRRALNWVIRQACGTYDFAYRPGQNDRDTNLALGRQFAGQQIVKLLGLNLATIRRKDARADPPEPR